MFSLGCLQNGYCDLVHIFEFLYVKSRVDNLINTAWGAHGEYVAPHEDWNNLRATIRLFTYRSKNDPNIVMMEFTRRVWVPMAVVADLQALLDDQAVSHQEKDDAIDTLVQAYRLRERRNYH